MKTKEAIEFSDCYYVKTSDIDGFKKNTETSSMNLAFALIPSNGCYFTPVLTKCYIHDFMSINQNITWGFFDYSYMYKTEIQLFINGEEVLHFFEAHHPKLQGRDFSLSISEKINEIFDYEKIKSSFESSGNIDMIRNTLQINNCKNLTNRQLYEPVSAEFWSRTKWEILKKNSWFKSPDIKKSQLKIKSNLPEYMYMGYPNLTIDYEHNDLLSKYLKYWNLFKKVNVTYNKNINILANTKMMQPTFSKEFKEVYALHKAAIPTKYNYIFSQLFNYCSDPVNYSDEYLTTRFERTVECCLYFLLLKEGTHKTLLDLFETKNLKASYYRILKKIKMLS